MIQQGEMIVHRAKKFNILALKENKFFELFKIRFYSNAQNQFAIFVLFPHFSKSKGILSKLVMPANQKKVKRLSLVPSGNLTTHLVKYSHWEDGNTHFSQDNKIVTSVRNLSSPLTSEVGHIFTVQLQGLEGYHIRPNLQKRKDDKITDLDFDIKDENTCLKFTGWWFDSTYITQNMKKGGPVIQIKMPDGTYKRGFAIAPPQEMKYPKYFLFLSGEIIPILSKRQKNLLTFIGGFDKPKPLTEDFHFLSFIYPVWGFNRLLQKLPNIDFLNAT